MIKFNKIQNLLRPLFWLWLCIILILMLIPTNGTSLYDFPGQDKLIHFSLFFILGFFFIIPRFEKNAPFRIAKENKSTYILLLFTISIEFFQLELSYRTFELLDMLMNILGVISGIFIGRMTMLKIFKH